MRYLILHQFHYFIIAGAGGFFCDRRRRKKQGSGGACTPSERFEMGVPGLFSIISRRYKACVRRAPDRPVRTLFVDFNCVVHSCVSEGATAVEVAEKCAARVSALAGELGASDVYMAADGVPAFAKMIQQRSRRFIARYVAPRCETRGFDRSLITPGTAFMDELDAWMGRWAARAADAREGGAVYAYSGTDEEGEGEQKVMRELRERPAASEGGSDGAFDGGAVDVVFGNDADLVLLGLMLPEGRRPLVCREEPGTIGSGGGGIAFVDGGVLLRELGRAVGLPGPARAEDVVVCSMLFGNDFLPPLSCLEVNEAWLERLVRCAARGEGMLRDGWRSGPGGGLTAALSDLVAGLAETEDRDFARADGAYWRAEAGRASRGKSQEEWWWERFPLVHRREELRNVRPGDAGWRGRYYGKLFVSARLGRWNGGRQDDKGGDGGGVAQTSARAFLAGVRWAVSYYAGEWPAGRGAQPPPYFYPFDYGPTSADLLNVLKQEDGDEDCDEDGDEEEDIDAVHISREALWRFVNPEPRGLDDVTAYLHPTSAELTTYLRHRVWHCNAMLPFPTDMRHVV